jgi:arabinose-5-phosphate isomerase
VNDAGLFAGIFTDGDFRRLESNNPAALSVQIGSVMTRKATRVAPDDLVGDAVRILREKKIDELPVVDNEGRVAGMLDIQDILGVGSL